MWQDAGVWTRIFISLGSAIGVHLAARASRPLLRRALTARTRSTEKAETLARFCAAIVVTLAYVVALGLVLYALGLASTAYVIGVAVIALVGGFGSRAILQDLVSGVTLLGSHQLDIGTVAELDGHVGVVERIGLCSTLLAGPTGAQISVPNRSVKNVVTYPAGYLTVVLDVRLPDDAAAGAGPLTEIRRVVEAAHEQFGDLMRSPPAILGREATAAGAYVRVEFKVWPGQTAVVENFVRQSLARALRQYDSAYADWMIAVHQRVDPARSPRPTSQDEGRHLSRRALLSPRRWGRR